MKTISEYSDDDLKRMLAKTDGVGGGKERAAAIRNELLSRNVVDDPASFFTSLQQTIRGDDAKEG